MVLVPSSSSLPSIALAWSFAFVLEFTAARISSFRTRSQRLQLPKQSANRMKLPDRWLQVKCRRWRPWEKHALQQLKLLTSCGSVGSSSGEQSTPGNGNTGGLAINLNSEGALSKIPQRKYSRCQRFHKENTLDAGRQVKERISFSNQSIQIWGNDRGNNITMTTKRTTNNMAWFNKVIPNSRAKPLRTADSLLPVHLSSLATDGHFLVVTLDSSKLKQQFDLV